MLNVLISPFSDIIEVNFLAFFLVVTECVFFCMHNIMQAMQYFFFRSSLCFNKMLNNINHTNL